VVLVERLSWRPLEHGGYLTGGHASSVTALAFSPNGAQQQQQQAMCWETETAQHGTVSHTRSMLCKHQDNSMHLVSPSAVSAAVTCFIHCCCCNCLCHCCCCCCPQASTWQLAMLTAR
jgi:hypothetical protein